MKNIYFISGFPRAGNTLLSTLLNQNPNISASAHSILPDVFYKLNELKYSDLFKNFPDETSLDNVMSGVFNNYYDNWSTDIIVDRGDWITPYNLSLLKKNYPNYKIVILVRDILDILRSYLTLCHENEDFEYNRFYNDIDKTTLYTNKDETICDLLMQKNHYINTILYSINNLINNNEKNIKFVEYKDLVNNTEDTLKSIYEFYDIDFFKHDLNNFGQHSANNLTYDDKILGAPMHTIRTNKIIESDNDVKLSEHIIRKYSNLEMWRNKGK